MDQEISGADPICRFVFQMNLDSVVFCSYLWFCSLKNTALSKFIWNTKRQTGSAP